MASLRGDQRDPQGIDSARRPRRIRSLGRGDLRTRRGKETIIIDASLMPVKDEQGNVVFITAEGRDIIEKKAHEREIARQPEELAKLDDITNSGLVWRMFLRTGPPPLNAQSPRPPAAHNRRSRRTVHHQRPIQQDARLHYLATGAGTTSNNLGSCHRPANSCSL